MERQLVERTVDLQLAGELEVVLEEVLFEWAVQVLRWLAVEQVSLAPRVRSVVEHRL